MFKLKRSSTYTFPVGIKFSRPIPVALSKTDDGVTIDDNNMNLICIF